MRNGRVMEFERAVPDSITDTDQLGFYNLLTGSGLVFSEFHQVTTAKPLITSSIRLKKTRNIAT